MRFLRILPLLGATAIWGMFVMPTPAPVERLVANVGEYVRTHPRDAAGYYRLGRIHYLAFALNSSVLASRKLGDRIEPDNGFSPGRAATTPVASVPLPPRQRAAHLNEALRLLQKAVELDPNSGLYLLGLACVYEDGQALQPQAGFREKAIANYLAAWQKTADQDQHLRSLPVPGIQSLVSYEAGNSYIRLVTERGIQQPDPAIAPSDRAVQPDEAANIRQIRKELTVLQGLRGPITPILLSLHPHAALRGLLAANTPVAFDLDGTGRPQSYSWLAPDAALLVWDPQHTGRITSGRQLFGAVTWWIFWDNGYQALAALDDNHDGWLRGPELAGLALWTDRNQNGISDPGEVVPVEQAGIEALSTTAGSLDGNSPMSAHGLRLANGQSLPTWDWMATPSPAIETTCRQMPCGAPSAAPHRAGVQ